MIATFHRSNNVDVSDRLLGVLSALGQIAIERPVILSLHPRTKDQLRRQGYSVPANVVIKDGIGFLEFLGLERTAFCAISDSGTVPEECTIFHVPSIVVRDFIERQELIDNGSVILCGTKTDDIIRAYETAKSLSTDWADIDDYFNTNVSDTVIKLLIGR